MTQYIGTQHTALPKNAQSWLRVRQHEETWRPASVNHSAESGMGIPQSLTHSIHGTDIFTYMNG